MRKSFGSQDGQTIVEYVLMVATAVMVVMVLTTTFRRSIFSIWSYFNQQIAAACPGCPVNSNYRIRN